MVEAQNQNQSLLKKVLIQNYQMYLAVTDSPTIPNIHTYAGQTIAWSEIDLQQQFTVDLFYVQSCQKAGLTLPESLQVKKHLSIMGVNLASQDLSKVQCDGRVEIRRTQITALPTGSFTQVVLEETGVQEVVIGSITPSEPQHAALSIQGSESLQIISAHPDKEVVIVGDVFFSTPYNASNRSVLGNKSITFIGQFRITDTLYLGGAVLQVGENSKLTVENGVCGKNRYQQGLFVFPANSQFE